MARFLALSPERPSAAVRRVRKGIVEVEARLSTQRETVLSPEGPVQAEPGDAVISDMQGRWRVGADRFLARYEALPPTRPGMSGRYRSRALEARAWRMTEAFEVLLADGVSLLQGQPGDWLLDYGDGELGIVTAAVFAQSYELLD